MEIFFNKFLNPTIGGLLIAVSTSINYCLMGESTGMSGIFKNFWKRQQLEKNLTIILGIMTASVFLYKLDPTKFFDSQASIETNLNVCGYALAGLLVGLGTGLGNGCTSGHGVCGLPRFSLRSWVYVPIFLVVAILSQNLIATCPCFTKIFVNGDNSEGQILFLLLTLCILSVVFYYSHKKNKSPAPQQQ